MTPNASPPDPLSNWLRHAVETMQLGVTISDAKGTIVYTNPADAEMHGYSTEALVGQHARIFAPPRTGRQLSTEELRAAERWQRDTVNVRRDGTTFPVRLLSDVLRDAAGEPVGMVTLCEDITERQAAEAQLRQAQGLEVLGQLTGGIAHDFNNVLTVILANTGLLASATPERWDDVRDLADEMHRVARQGAALARRLLAFSRQEHLTFEPVDIGAEVREYHEVLGRLLPETIEVRVAVEDRIPAASADRHALQQILLNLATNARDAMPSGGILRLQVGRATMDAEFVATHGWGLPGQYVALVVSDTGIGMDEQTRQHVFQPFFTTKPREKGSGLGMAIVYALMKQHGGFVHAYSEPGEGSTFRLWFPLANAPVVAVARSESPPVGGTETVLVAEDEAPIRRATRRVLEHYGYTVHLAVDGEEAWDVLEENAGRIDVVVSDLGMPRLSGRGLYQRVRSAGNAVPFVFASGYTIDDVQEATAIPSDVPFLQKPWTMVDLLLRVREALDRPRGAAARS